MNPRYPFGVYTISNRARSASYATSPSALFDPAQLYYSIFADLSSTIFVFLQKKLTEDETRKQLTTSSNADIMLGRFKKC